MTPTLQLEQVEVSTKVIELYDAPRLLIEWSPRWHEFITSIRPALSPSGPRLAGESPHGGVPYGKITASLLLQCFFVFVLAVLPHEIQGLRPYAVPKLKPYEVIYYSGDELPRVEDLGGSHTGTSGRAGGREAQHSTQTIHVARGGALSPRIVDAPDLKIPASSEAVANLLALKSAPAKANLAPPSSEGLQSSFRASSLAGNVIAPAPADISRDQSRKSIAINTVIPPAPEVSPDAIRTAPTLNAAVVPPAPTVRSEHTLFMPELDPTVIAPAPKVPSSGTRAAPSLSPGVIAPPSTTVSDDRARSAPTLQTSVIPPAPTAAGHEVAPSRVRMHDANVVPPPVSAPERDSARAAKLSLPAPSVIAPPPSADSTHDLRRLEAGGNGATSPTVVPPPPTPAGNTSFVSGLIGKIFGTQEVVPPPPSVPPAGSRTTGTLAGNVIPPPPAASANGGPSGIRGASLKANIVPPPPNIGSQSNGNAGAPRTASLGSNIVPPPPSVSAPDSRVSARNASPGSGTLLANNVVPPPPTVSTGTGSGSGRKAVGLGAPGDGSALAPPKNTSESNDHSGVVISSQPGSKVGLPGNGGKGSLAMSPSGGDKAGIGGSGNREGIGRGEGAGSGLAGTGSGVGKVDAGHGSDANARGGISPTPGPGGAGSAPMGVPAVPGVDVRGGSSAIVTLPSFASDGSAEANLPSRSSVKQQPGPAITIVATSRSGGAFDFYGKLPGDNYTVYVDTTMGTVVMQFAEVSSGAHAGALTGPQGMRTDLPPGLPHARFVVKCVLDASGNLKNFQVLEPGPAGMAAKIMAALPSWKFRPATRGVQPVEVNAILGFNIDTNDRY